MKQRLSFGFSGLYSAAQTIELVKMSEDAGLESVWVAEDYFDAGGFSLAAACAMHTSVIQIGIGVINPYTRHPTLAAMEAATLDEVSGGRAIVALGASNKKWMELQAGIPYVKPITATKECVQIMKQLIGGNEINFQGEYFKTGRVKLNNKAVRPNQPIFMGVKGDKALEAAGEVADGVLLSAGSPVEYVKYAREKIAIGAARAGRDPKEVQVAAYLPTYIDMDGAAAKEKAKGMTARYMGLHGPKPIMTIAGLDPEVLQQFQDAFMRGTAMPNVTDQMVDALAVAGTPDQCRQRIEDYIEAGVDMPVIFEAPGVLPPAQCIENLKRYLVD